MEKKKLYEGQVQGDFLICLRVRAKSEYNARKRMEKMLAGDFPVFEQKLRGKGEWIYLHFDETFEAPEIMEIKERE